jgi:DNA gyrase subunit A
MRADAVPQQSRAATGVRLQRLDAGDRLTEVVLVPPAAAEPEENLDHAPALEGKSEVDLEDTDPEAGEP